MLPRALGSLCGLSPRSPTPISHLCPLTLSLTKVCISGLPFIPRLQDKAPQRHRSHLSGFVLNPAPNTCSASGHDTGISGGHAVRREDRAGVRGGCGVALRSTYLFTVFGDCQAQGMFTAGLRSTHHSQNFPEGQCSHVDKQQDSHDPGDPVCNGASLVEHHSLYLPKKPRLSDTTRTAGLSRVHTVLRQSFTYLP